MPFRDFDSYRPALSRILQTTLDYHGNPANPWGISPDPTRHVCEYIANCSIGLSLEPETARIADEARAGDIRTLLNDDSTEAERVCQDLFDTPKVTSSVVLILGLLQRYHDTLALNRENTFPESNAARRAIYVQRVRRLARFARIPLPENAIPQTYLLQDSSDRYRTHETALVVIDSSGEGVDLKICDKSMSVQLAHVHGNFDP